MSDQTIRIAYPLSLDVAGALTRAIGLMWPEAMIDTTDERHLTIRLHGKAKRVSQKAIRSAAPQGEPDEDEDESELANYDGSTLTVHTEPQYNLAAWALALLDAGGEAAINYVEQEARTKDGRRLTVCASWSNEQTPHQLRMAAEAEVERLRAEVNRLTEVQS